MQLRCVHCRLSQGLYEGRPSHISFSRLVPVTQGRIALLSDAGKSELSIWQQLHSHGKGRNALRKELLGGFWQHCLLRLDAAVRAA
jgi:hypothetical protein